MTLRTGDLEQRCYALSAACRERGMGKSHALHIASRMLGAAAELICLAGEIDGTDEAEEIRRLSTLYLEERARADRLSERVFDVMQGR